MKPETVESAPEGLKGLARKLTAKKPDAPSKPRGKDAQPWDMKTLLAAAEQGEMRSLPRSGGNSSGTKPGEYWSLQHPGLYTLFWIALILAIFVPLSVNRYKKATSR